MDRLSLEDLKTLAAAGADDDSLRVSLYSPMYRAGREVQQNAIRFKNLVRDARERLEQADCDDDVADRLLAPAEAKLGDDHFWQHQSDGLAAFLDSDGMRLYRLPHSFTETVRVGDRYHLQPLTRLLTDDHHWYILAASPKRVRLLQASLRSVEDLEPDTFPKNLRDALRIDEYVSSLQFHSTDRGGSAAVHHGHGGSDPDVKKQDELLQYFHRLDDALDDYLADRRWPLLFAGVEYLFPIFRETCSYPKLVEEPLTGNPDDLSPQELHEKSLTIMRPRMEIRRRAALDAIQEKLHGDWASDDPDTICRAAEMGQVETLVLDADSQHPSDDAVADTIHCGGRVLTLDEVPDGSKFPASGMAALFRSPVPAGAQTK